MTMDNFKKFLDGPQKRRKFKNQRSTSVTSVLTEKEETDLLQQHNRERRPSSFKISSKSQQKIDSVSCLSENLLVPHPVLGVSTSSNSHLTVSNQTSSGYEKLSVDKSLSNNTNYTTGSSAKSNQLSLKTSVNSEPESKNPNTSILVNMIKASRSKSNESADSAVNTTSSSSHSKNFKNQNKVDYSQHSHMITSFGIPYTSNSKNKYIRKLSDFMPFTKHEANKLQIAALAATSSMTLNTACTCVSNWNGKSLQNSNSSLALSASDWVFRPEPNHTCQTNNNNHPHHNFLTLQIDGYWYENKTNTSVKLTNTPLNQLCPKEIDTLSILAIEKLKKIKTIPSKDLVKYDNIKEKNKIMNKVKNNLGKRQSLMATGLDNQKSDISNENLATSNFSLFGDKLSDVVERDTLQRLQQLNINELYTNPTSSNQNNSNVDNLSSSSIGVKSQPNIQSAQKDNIEVNQLSRRRSGIRTISIGQHESELLEALSFMSQDNKTGSKKSDKNLASINQNDRLNSNFSTSNLSIGNSSESSITNSNHNYANNFNLNPLRETSILPKTKSKLNLTLSSSKFKSSSIKHKHQSNLSEDLLISEIPSVPLIVLKCCEFITEHGLETTGIFRKSAAASKIKELKSRFEQQHVNGNYMIDPNEFNSIEVACVFKEYIRKLPEPLIPCEYFKCFTSLPSLEDSDLQIECLRYLLSLLPTESRDTLYIILKFLTKVIEYKDVNLMDVNNIATIFGPCILKPKPVKQTANQLMNESIMKENAAIVSVTTLFITEATSIFTIPGK